MLGNLKKKIDIVLGDLDFKNGPYEIFDPKIIDFLNEISKEVLKNKECKQYPDLISFGFWCRVTNILSIFKNYENFENRIGRGTILHITPSNVPTNYAYSIVFGLLSGNNNIIRLPSKNFHQLLILNKILKKLSKKKKFMKYFKRFSLIKYKNSDLISSELSKIVEGRLIWGGDKTIKKFKSFSTKPRCIDLTFADRYSISILDAEKVSKLNKDKLRDLAQKFYNDTYTMDQYGCSSPNSLFWLGKNNNAKEKFWLELENIAIKKKYLDFSVVNKKISNLMFHSISKNKNMKINLKNINVIRLKDKNINFDTNKNINFGTFYEFNLKNLNFLKGYVSEKLQTVTYFGLTFNQIKNFIIKNNVKGIDRVIPVGRAFDMTTEWDGVDIVSTLSRTIGS